MLPLTASIVSSLHPLSRPALDALQIAPFRARLPWWGGDLQTLRNSLRPDPAELSGQRIHLTMSDGSGDQLAALLHQPVQDPIADAPLLILIHGLGGTETSTYMTMSARALSDAGYPVLRLNLRGAGPSRAISKLQYHAGRSQDLRDVIRSLPSDLQSRGVVPIGFSLGGNMLLKFMAEFAAALPVRGAISVSAPIDLALTASRMVKPRNYLYNQKLLKDYKAQSLGKGAYVSDQERQAILKSRNFTDIDNWFVAPRNGFDDAEDYWRQCMAQQFLTAIPLPTLILHAADDPMVPVAPYLDFDWSKNQKLLPLVSSGGGHMGFHGSRGPWYLEAFFAFLNLLK
jgi:predicted alpha/beta-fold hydrolase